MRLRLLTLVVAAAVMPAAAGAQDYSIAFTHFGPLNSDIFIVRLSDSPGNDAHATWSPDGQWIAFSSVRGGFKDEAALTPATRRPRAIFT